MKKIKIDFMLLVIEGIEYKGELRQNLLLF